MFEELKKDMEQNALKEKVVRGMMEEILREALKDDDIPEDMKAEIRLGLATGAISNKMPKFHELKGEQAKKATEYLQLVAEGMDTFLKALEEGFADD